MNKKQILRRIFQIVIVLIGISFVTFLLTYLSPGDPVRNMFSATGVMPTEELVQQTRDEMGLNDPFFTQYFRWLFNCLRGDFGKSYSLNKPVVELLAARVLPTLKLTLMSLILMLLMAVPLGVASALHKDGIIDYICRAVTFVGCAMPNFWVGLLLMMLLCVQIQVFPVIASGGAGTLEHFYDALTEGGADAALAASLFHYKELEIRQVKEYLAGRGISVRR